MYTVGVLPAHTTNPLPPPQPKENTNWSTDCNGIYW